MNIEKINLNNYKNIVKWYSAWNLPITPYSYIPKNAFIVENFCAGFLYQLDNTPLFWIEGIISNPEIKDKSVKNKALALLINKLEEVAKANNCEILMSSTPRSSLNSLFLDLGFKNTPENYFHLAKRS